MEKFKRGIDSEFASPGFLIVPLKAASAITFPVTASIIIPPEFPLCMAASVRIIDSRPSIVTTLDSIPPVTEG